MLANECFADTPPAHTPYDHLVVPVFVLRGPDDIEDMAADVAPLAGTLIALHRTDSSWHGHKPFGGPRKPIMLNRVVDDAAARCETLRHTVSAGGVRLFAA